MPQRGLRVPRRALTALLLPHLLLAAAATAAEPEVIVRARAVQPGEMVLVAVKKHSWSRPPAGTFAGVPLAFLPGSPGIYAALAAVDLEASTGTARLELDLLGRDGIRHLWGSDVMIEEKAFPTQKIQVEDKYVALSTGDAARSEREAARLSALFAQSSPERLFLGRFVSPIPGASTARFGERRIFNDVPKSPHSGADLRAKAGTPVKAAARGRVVLADGLFYAGNSVLIDHGLGLYTYYAHLSTIAVREGQIVEQGARLGLVGATGRVTGPHLHWAVKFRGARVDPFSLTALDLDRWWPQKTRR